MGIILITEYVLRIFFAVVITNIVTLKKKLSVISQNKTNVSEHNKLTKI